MIRRLKDVIRLQLTHLIIIVFYLLLIFQSCAQSIKLLRGPSFDIALTELNTIVKIPVTLVPDSGSLHLRLIDVSFDDPLRTITDTSFYGQLETDRFQNSFIIININNKFNLDQGKYHLTFNIFKSKSTSPPEPLYLDLVVKPATLAPVSNLIVVREQPFLWCPFSPSYTTLTLFETSRSAILSPVTIRELGLADGTGKIATASIRFTDSILRIPAGQQGNFSYKVEGDLPVGTVSGNYEITAPQLAAPVLFKMEIITKRGGWWIILLILAGLLFGYITRIFLENMLQLNRSRKEAFELSRLLSREKEDRPDNTFGLAIDEMQKDLRVSVEEKGSDIAAVIASVKTKLAVAYAKLDTDKAALQTKLTALSDSLAGTWFLPERIETLIATARTGLNQVNSVKDNPGAGEAAIKELQLTLANNLVVETENFEKKLNGTFEAIKQSTLKIPVPGSPLLADIDQQINVIATIPAEDFDADPAKIKTLLQAVSSQRKKTGRLFSEISLAINAQLETLITTFTRGRVDLQQEILDIEQKFNAGFNVDSNKALDNTINSLATYMKDIQNEILITLTSAKLGLDANQSKTISDAIAAGNYTIAAENIVGFKAPRIENETVTESGGVETPETVSQHSILPDNNIGLLLGPLALSFIKADSSAFNTRYKKITDNIFWTSLMQNGLIGLGIAVFGYPLFAEKFTGTVADMIEVFSWSFVLNISINTLTTAAGGISKKLVP